MYNNKFCEIYDKYGWDYFSITMGDAILKYFDNNKIKIKTNIDLCCGVGTLCDFFHNKGIKTTGIDISSSMIKIAKEKYPSIDFFQKNVCTYADNNKYDLVTCTCDAINHIKNIEAIKKLFNNIYKLLNFNGYFIFDIYDKDKSIFNKKIHSVRDNGIIVEYLITKKDNDLINTKVTVLQNNKFIHEENIVEQLYSIEVIEKLLIDTGFRIIKCNKQIFNEEQRFKDKLYLIVEKI